MSLAFVYLATRVPSMLGNHGTFDAWLHTLYFGMSLPGAMLRSGRALAMLGGPAGAAAAAATTAATTAANTANSAAQTATPSAQPGPAPRSHSHPGDNVGGAVDLSRRLLPEEVRAMCR